MDERSKMNSAHSCLHDAASTLLCHVSASENLSVCIKGETNIANLHVKKQVRFAYTYQVFLSMDSAMTLLVEVLNSRVEVLNSRQHLTASCMQYRRTFGRYPRVIHLLNNLNCVSIVTTVSITPLCSVKQFECFRHTR